MRLARSIADGLKEIHPARWTLALSALVFATLAWTIGSPAGAVLGHCLSGAPDAPAHCGWCYASITALLAAAAPAPSSFAKSVAGVGGRGKR